MKNKNHNSSYNNRNQNTFSVKKFVSAAVPRIEEDEEEREYMLLDDMMAVRDIISKIEKPDHSYFFYYLSNPTYVLNHLRKAKFYAYVEVLKNNGVCYRLEVRRDFNAETRNLVTYKQPKTFVNNKVYINNPIQKSTKKRVFKVTPKRANKNTEYRKVNRNVDRPQVEDAMIEDNIQETIIKQEDAENQQEEITTDQALQSSLDDIIKRKRKNNKKKFRSVRNEEN